MYMGGAINLSASSAGAAVSTQEKRSRGHHTDSGSQARLLTSWASATGSSAGQAHRQANELHEDQHEWHVASCLKQRFNWEWQPWSG